MEVNTILENLKVICPSSTLHLDSTFKTCISEEITAYWKDSNLVESLVVFKINESGEVVFDGIKESVSGSDYVSFPIDSPKKIAEKLAKELEEAKKLAEEKAKLAEKSVAEITESLSKVELDRKKHELLDYLLRQKNESI